MDLTMQKKAKWTAGGIAWRLVVTVAIVAAVAVAGLVPLVDVLATMAAGPTLWMVWCAE